MLGRGKDRLNALRLLQITCCLITILLTTHTTHADTDQDVYSNTWAVHIEGGHGKAKQIADNHGFIFVDEIMKDHYTFHHHHVSRRSTSASREHHTALDSHPEVLWFEQQIIKKRVKRDYKFTVNDPLFKDQWYLSRSDGDRRLLDMNLIPAWKQGYTGKGVVVTILDDGIERDHTDLKQNYDSRASKDINGRDGDPMPRYEYTNENRHGTRCAGEVAAAANNSKCGIGVAYNANIGGIRMLDGDVTDSVEATSLSFNRDHIDIYSASWGPDDDGRTVDGPGVLARKAFQEGVRLGRRGKGSLFIWASGNGGRDKDSCNCDGYTNSIYTLSISSATENGNVPWYSEACSSTLATTYSSGNAFERQIVTTDLRNLCTEEHTGTSASAPLAAGIAALVLQANARLTWRDMQHLVVMSANPHNLQADDWVVNGVGRRVSHHFGYGIMNAGKMVELAKNWTNVPQQRVCETRAHQGTTRYIPPQDKVQIKYFTSGCEGTANHVVYLEHVQAKISLTSSFRGDIVIWLTSPMGTKSCLLSARVNDNNNKGFNEWEFMTTHNWGEYAEGEWLLEIENGYRASEPAKLLDWNLVLYGTSTDPLIQAKPKSRTGEHIRKIKQRDHDPTDTGGGISIDVVDAKSGIILPDIHWMMANNRPKAKPYNPPKYKPSNRPDFEYIQSSHDDNTNDEKHTNKQGSVGGHRLGPVVFNHGDHQHRIGNDGLLEDIISPGGDGHQHSQHVTNHRLGTAATLKDFTLVLHGTQSSPYNKNNHPSISEILRSCPTSEVLYKDECVQTCPHGWYRRRGICYPCHVSCAACVSAKNISCTECYYGSYLQDGVCLPLGEGVKINAGTSLQDDSLPPNTLWWLMVGATIAVCMLVIFLVLLAIYYAYTQRYLCTDSASKERGSGEQSPQSSTSRSASMNTETTNDSAGLSVKPGENVRLTSQNSSQQELMTASEDEAEVYLETHRLRGNRVHHGIV